LAASVRGSFSDGVWFVDLAPLRDPALVPQEIARAVGLREAAGQTPAAQLRAFVRGRCLLLVLDNLEHLLGAAPEVAGLLAAGPPCRVLATSRAVLRLRGEHVLEVPPLAVPPPPPPRVDPAGGAPGAGPSAGDSTDAVGPVAASPAVRLFCERARV